MVSRAALGLLVLVGMQQFASAQTKSAQTASSMTPLLVSAPAPDLNIVPTKPTPELVAQLPPPGVAAPVPGANCAGVSPYDNYSCLDAYLGDGFFERLFNYYQLEWGRAGPPTDPSAPPGQIAGWPRIPATVPPMAYVDWPSGAVETIGDTQPNSVDTPLMAALANTSLGQWMQEHHFQVYGWVEPGFNISSNTTKPGGNGPIGYSYTPNVVQLDQAVVYLDRFPDTVQTDHFDWGMRLSMLFGENYRYTNSYGIWSNQFNGKNKIYGWDPVMEYADLYWPKPFNGLVEGLEVRIGRYISIPDIEAQLAPNNLTYTHSMTYTWDNYTNEGIVTSWQITPNIMLQLGITDGTETPIWHNGVRETNLMPGNPLYPGNTFPKDPGNQPSATACLQLKWNNGWDTLYPCIDGINDGAWGYNNIQWHGFTYYHRFNDQWHIDFESYYLSENRVPNLNNANAAAIVAGGGTPFSPQFIPRNSTNLAYCNTTKLACNVSAYSLLLYTNYTPDPLNNFTVRTEWYDDPNGWRTGTGGRTEYYDLGFSWQHWLSPQIDIRPEITWWRSIGTAAFNGYPAGGIAGNKKSTEMFAADLTFHF